MKKILLLIPFLMLLTACGKPAESALPSINIITSESESESHESSSVSSETESFYLSKLTPENSTLTTDDSSEKVHVDITSLDGSKEYGIEIGNPCYLKNLSSGLQEIIVKPGAYISSFNGTYKVNRLIIDFYGGKGVNFEVYNNLTGEGTPLAYHESNIAAADPSDGGQVYEYEINGKDWIIKNNTEFNKPGFYSISVVYSNY